MAWHGPWGGWWGQQPPRNRASRMSCEQAKAHAMQFHRWHLVGPDGYAHVIGANEGLCGAKQLGIPITPGKAFAVCPECSAILAEIESVTA